MADDLPAGLFRNAIDLNRYSNGVSRKLIESYNRIIIRAVAELKRIEAMPSSQRPKMKAARLRALLAQTRKSLNGWSGESVADLAKELEGVAQIQSDFATAQIKKALPIGARNAVRSVEVTPAFAKSVVNADPLKVGTNLLSQSLTEAVKGSTPSFSLSAKQGAQVLMPGGESITKLFRGIAEKQAEMFGQVVQDGLLTGETTESLARQLIGNLDFGQKAQSARQLAMAGGQATKMANHQVMTLVRTSVNQVSNVASQQVYKANPEVTKKYRYVATLDGKTSPICRSLDGEEFEYGKGPTPAQHMNCRSTTVAVIDYKGLGISEATQAKIAGIGKRAAAGGSVPTGTTYGKWLYDQRKKGTKFGAGAEQVRALGKEKAAYFNRLAAKYGPDQAMKKFMREDGGEITLKKLEQRYGKASSIKSVVKKKKAAPKPKKSKFAQELALLDKQLKEQKDVVAKIEKELEANEKKTKAKLKAIDAKISNIGKPKIKIGKGIDPIHNDYKTKKLEQWEMKQHYDHWSAKLHKSKVGSATSDKALMHMNKLKEAGLKIPGNQFLASNMSDDLKGFMSKNVVKGKDVNEFKTIAKNKEAELKKLKSGFKKKTTATTTEYDYVYGRDTIKKMGYKLDSEGFSDEFDEVKNQIQRWKGSSGSFQGVQYERLSKEGKKLSRYGESSRRTFGGKASYQKKLEATEKMEDFLSRAPSYKGEISRGMKIEKEDFNSFVKDLASGNPSATMESWSAHRSVAANFAEVDIASGGIFYEGSGSEVPVVMRVKNNKYGSPIANVGVGFEDEAEILMPSNVRYRLTDITKMATVDEPDEYFYEIILEQL